VSKLFRLDLLLLLLSIGLAIYIYFSPSIIVLGHMDLKGAVNGSSSKETIFVLPAVALFVYIVFNALEKYPSFLIKGESANDPQTQESTLFYWRILKILSLLSMDCILIVINFPKIRILLLAVIGIFTVYNIIFLFKAQHQSK
jgi:hypothetical protein